MTKTVPATNNAGKRTLDTHSDWRPGLHAVGSLGVQSVPCLLGSKHTGPIGDCRGHGSSQRCRRSVKEVHQQGRVWVALRHDGRTPYSHLNVRNGASCAHHLSENRLIREFCIPFSANNAIVLGWREHRMRSFWRTSRAEQDAMLLSGLPLTQHRPLRSQGGRSRPKATPGRRREFIGCDGCLGFSPRTTGPVTW